VAGYWSAQQRTSLRYQAKGRLSREFERAHVQKVKAYPSASHADPSPEQSFSAGAHFEAPTAAVIALKHQPTPLVQEQAGLIMCRANWHLPLLLRFKRSWESRAEIPVVMSGSDEVQLRWGLQQRGEST